MRDIDRRDFLKLSGLSALAAVPFGFGRSALAQDRPGARAATSVRTKHVILVAFAGGVRSRETIRTPENIPNLMKIAKEGVILPHVAARNLGHYGAALSIFTGQLEEKISKDNDRTASPTVFEYVRKQRGLDARSVWLTTSGGDQQLNYAYGTSPDYGSKYGASLAGGDGLWNAQLRGLVDRFGRPRPDEPRDREKLDELRRALEPATLDERAAVDAPPLDEATRRRLERCVLDEITGGTTGLTGAGAGDARAIRVARNVLAAFHPVLLGIALSNADVAHGSMGGYVEVIRRNDQELGALWAAVQADPELRGATAIIVLPEFGRDKEPNQRQGLDHADASKDHLEVACFAAGPDFRSDAVVNEEVRTTQVCPTICELLGVTADKTKEKPIREMLA